MSHTHRRISLPEARSRGALLLGSWKLFRSACDSTRCMHRLIISASCMHSLSVLMSYAALLPLDLTLPALATCIVYTIVLCHLTCAGLLSTSARARILPVLLSPSPKPPRQTHQRWGTTGAPDSDWPRMGRPRHLIL